MKRCLGSRIGVSASVAGIALVAAFAACVTDRSDVVICQETNLECPPHTVCAMEGNRCDPEGCGDGREDTANGERCDDGNRLDGDGCSADCKVREFCGNGVVDRGEECDSSAPDSEGPCGPDCRPLEKCGDGEVNPGEDCDEGIDNTPRSAPMCDDDCTIPWCGDGWHNPVFVNPATGRPEECDEGENTATCDADCTLPECGDGLFNAFFVHPITERPEECDDGEETASCDQDCTLPVCGDEHVNAAAGERCEDGNGSNEDACPDGIGGTCQPARCGDNFKQTNVEECDNGGDSITCNGPGAGSELQCKPARCGDEYVNTAAGEACDDGDGEEPADPDDEDPDDGDACPSGTPAEGDDRIRCQPARCGDGFTRAGFEGCDDGNGNNADRCPDGIGGTCQNARCGDGFLRTDLSVDDREQCDDGNSFDFDDCPSSTPVNDDDERTRCRPARCGDGFLRLDEQCDPGSGDDDSPQNTPACDSDCTLPVCGDGHENTAAGEECDDDDNSNFDDCPSGLGGACQDAECGDGFVWRDDVPMGQEAEICDDGVDSATCNGGSVAARNARVACRPPTCGDGYVNLAAGEECETLDDCDEGNGICIPPGSAGQCRCVEAVR